MTDPNETSVRETTVSQRPSRNDPVDPDHHVSDSVDLHPLNFLVSTSAIRKLCGSMNDHDEIKTRQANGIRSVHDLLPTLLPLRIRVFTMNIKLAIAALFVATTAGTAMGQTTASQRYTVTVPSAISITAPANAALTHDQSENDQPFPPQAWVVRGNSLAGVTATFSTTQAFRHTTEPTARRNAALNLGVNTSVGAASWTVTQPTDTTDFATNDGVATVQVTSNGFGRATMDLGVSFVTDGFGTFPAGDYETTVTGTVTSN